MSSNGVSPSPVRAFGSAPALRSAVTVSGVWLNAAECSGVKPFQVRAFGSAPALRRAVTTSGVLLRAAAAGAAVCGRTRRARWGPRRR